MTGRRKLRAVATGCALFVLAAGAFVYSSVDVANGAIRYHLKTIGESIYEYHSRTGQWPSRPEDLEILPLWHRMLNDGAYVVVWHTNLKPEAKDNAGRVLVYHDKGLLASFGWMWVCWGDLRIEYAKAKRVRDSLAAEK